jgi:hypothetical protein
MTPPYELRSALDPAAECAPESIVDLGDGLFCDPHITPTLPLANSEETWRRRFDGGNGQPADRAMPCRHQAEFLLDSAEIFSRHKEFDVVLHFGTLYHLPNPLLLLSDITCATKTYFVVIFRTTSRTTSLTSQWPSMVGSSPKCCP